jgi:anaerobic magnesium-protoporphyrin IX monomethyl ester cyclase
MRALLLSGLGPGPKNQGYFSGSLFDVLPNLSTRRMLARARVPRVRLNELKYRSGATERQLLRPATDKTAHLTTFTLQSILERSGHDYVHIDMAEVWNDAAPGDIGDVDVVLLSTTYIWNPRMLRQAVEWIARHLPGVPVVAGGQYTNLKYSIAMATHPEIIAVIRGDAEVALPALLDRLAGRRDLVEVPNLVWRDERRLAVNRIEYIDLDGFSSPTFPGALGRVPYESMRGCPFDCAFCGFPLATPKWRYKSAEKIRNDWVRYAEENNAGMIEAMDSTFTVPPRRLRELFDILPATKVPWACYSRANVINSTEFVDKLLAAHCFRLVIGFESMSDETLTTMSKRVTASQNRRALELLKDSAMDYSICFIVGYPGETRETFEETRRFLVDDYQGHFSLHMFGMTDETMPVWQQRDLLKIEVDDPYDLDSEWSHIGMDSGTAKSLQTAALDEIRRTNDKAVVDHWQDNYQRPLMPEAPPATNLAVEKAIERLALVARDHSDVDAGAAHVNAQLDVLQRQGVTVDRVPASA